MSTDLKSRTNDVSLTRFWGGHDRGACVQVTMPRDTERFPFDTADKFFNNVHLTREQALTLARDLLDFACEDEQEHLGPDDDDREWTTTTL